MANRTPPAKDQAPPWGMLLLMLSLCGPMMVVFWAWGLALLALFVAGPFILLGLLFS